MVRETGALRQAGPGMEIPLSWQVFTGHGRLPYFSSPAPHWVYD